MISQKNRSISLLDRFISELVQINLLARQMIRLLERLISQLDRSNQVTNQINQFARYINQLTSQIYQFARLIISWIDQRSIDQLIRCDLFLGHNKTKTDETGCPTSGGRLAAMSHHYFPFRTTTFDSSGQNYFFKQYIKGL